MLPRGTRSSARPTLSESATSRANNLLTVRWRKLRRRDKALLASAPCIVCVTTVPPVPFWGVDVTVSLSVSCLLGFVACGVSSPSTSMAGEVRLPSLQDASNSSIMTVVSVICVSLFMCVSCLSFRMWVIGYLLIILTLRLASRLRISSTYVPATGRYRRVV